jgi:2-oxoglutarate ferredoxin oxidoreductase subunit gamma
MDGVTKIIIAGEGGQGVQVVGEILALAGNLAGKEALYIPNFGVEQRGGVSMAFVQVGESPIGAPKFKYADIVVALSNRAMERTRGYVTPRSSIIYDNSGVSDPVIADKAIGIQSWDTMNPEGFANMTGEKAAAHLENPKDEGRVMGIPAARIAKTQMHPRVFNILILGAISRLLHEVDSDIIKKALSEKLGAKFIKNPELKTLNFEAFERGRKLVQEYGGVDVK